MNGEVLKKGLDARTKNEKLQICLENYNKMRAERNTAKQQIKELCVLVEKNMTLLHEMFLLIYV
jgi:hypothetical protein